MGRRVFVNGRGIACKASSGRSIAAFPDVCLSPPSPPAGPIPIPYPNTGMASDTADGSKTVKVHGKEVMLRNKSYFKKSTGDEAATKSFGMNVLSHQIQGKVYFASWSMNVKIEGENAVRHMDLTTHNHASEPAGTPPCTHTDKSAFKEPGKVCEDQKKAADEKCAGAPKTSDGKGLDCREHTGCAEAKACVLRPKNQDKSFCCSPDTTGHHLVEVHCFTATNSNMRLQGFERYKPGKAPCVCASMQRYHGKHGEMHSVQGKLESAYYASGKTLRSWPGMARKLKKGGNMRGPAESKWTYGQARDAGLLAHKIAFPHCNAACTKNQLDEYHKNAGINEETPLRTDPVPRKGGPLSAEQAAALDAEISRLSGTGAM